MKLYVEIKDKELKELVMKKIVAIFIKRNILLPKEIYKLMEKVVDKQIKEADITSWKNIFQSI